MAIEAITGIPSNNAVSSATANNTGSVTSVAGTTGDTGRQPVSTDSSEVGHPYDSTDPYQLKNSQDVSASDIKKAVNEINHKIRQTHTSCQYSYHEDTNRISIKVIDDETSKVIREIPPEKTLDIIAKTLELEGILVDEKR